jgi:hypothetical protein
MRIAYPNFFSSEQPFPAEGGFWQRIPAGVQKRNHPKKPPPPHAVLIGAVRPLSRSVLPRQGTRNKHKSPAA